MEKMEEKDDTEENKKWKEFLEKLEAKLTETKDWARKNDAEENKKIYEELIQKNLGDIRNQLIIPNDGYDCEYPNQLQDSRYIRNHQLSGTNLLIEKTELSIDSKIEMYQDAYGGDYDDYYKLLSEQHSRSEASESKQYDTFFPSKITDNPESVENLEKIRNGLIIPEYECKSPKHLTSEKHYITLKELDNTKSIKQSKYVINNSNFKESTLSEVFISPETVLNSDTLKLSICFIFLNQYYNTRNSMLLEKISKFVFDNKIDILRKRNHLEYKLLNSSHYLLLFGVDNSITKLSESLTEMDDNIRRNGNLNEQSLYDLTETNVFRVLGLQLHKFFSSYGIISFWRGMGSLREHCSEKTGQTKTEFNKSLHDLEQYNEKFVEISDIDIFRQLEFILGFDNYKFIKPSKYGFALDSEFHNKINEYNSQGITLLQYSFQQGNYYLATALIKYNADTNMFSSDGRDMNQFINNTSHKHKLKLIDELHSYNFERILEKITEPVITKESKESENPEIQYVFPFPSISDGHIEIFNLVAEYANYTPLIEEQEIKQFEFTSQYDLLPVKVEEKEWTLEEIKKDNMDGILQNYGKLWKFFFKLFR